MTGRRRKPGKMGPFIAGYRRWLMEFGYAPGTVINMLAMAGNLGRWMDIRDIAAGDLDRAAIAEFRSAMRAAPMRCVPGAHGLDRLLQYLDREGVLIVSGLPATPAEDLMQRYRRWLVDDRGLAVATVVRHVTTVMAFSPTDTMPPVRWAKVLMTLQAMVAVSTLALVFRPRRQCAWLTAWMSASSSQ